jgi:beta-glucanase (GH16 family)
MYRMPGHSRTRCVLTLQAATLILSVALASDKPVGGSAPEACVDRPILEEDFSNGQLDACSWILVRENWGGKVEDEDYNGGVVPENVSVGDGMVHLRAHGNRYVGDIRGIASDGHARPDGRRTGAAIMTRQRFLGGRFEARVRMITKLGVCSAMWTFFYDNEPGKPVRNHEIDIEFPGREHIDAPPSFQHVALTTWTGLEPGQSRTEFRPLGGDEEQFHTLRFDWQPTTAASSGYVDFYIDGALVYSAHTNIPSEPAPLWLGVWFPKDWAGTPDFGDAEMLVDWVRISPLQPKT